MQRVDTLEKTLMLGKIKGKRRSRQQRMRWLDGTGSRHMNLSKLWEIAKDREPGVLQSMESQRVRHDLVTEQQYVYFLYNTESLCCTHETDTTL